MAAYFKTRDGICKTIQLALSLAVLILCVLSSFWSVKGTQSMYVVLAISAFCSFTLTISGIIYFCQLYYLCLASRSWNNLEIYFGIFCGALMFASMCLSAYMTIQFDSLERPPKNFKGVNYSQRGSISQWPLPYLQVLSACTTFNFVAYLCLIKQKGPISTQRLREHQQDEQHSYFHGFESEVAMTWSQSSPSPATPQRGEQINLAVISKSPKTNDWRRQDNNAVLHTTFVEQHVQSPTYIDVTVVQGSIMSANCDAIVNSTQSFAMSGQVGSLLVALGGQSIADDCANNPMYSSTNLRITDAGALLYKFIFHLNVPKSVYRLENALLEMFKEADKRGVSSLAMPPVGTGGIGLQAQEVAKCIRRAIDKFKITTPNVLQSISIYVFEQAMVGTFQQELVRSRNDVSNSVLPANWDDMGGQLLKRVVLSPNSQEYQRILALFNETLQINVSKIERIQNPTLCNQFQAQKKKVTDVLAGRRPIITRELFHGTDTDKFDSICNQGFDKGRAGKNGIAYGKGVYFATTARYSNGYASGNLKHMFLAEVITGEYCQGDRSMNVAPNQPNGSPYDSVVDNMSNPSMFVVFKDASVYPAYLVTYSTF